MEQQAKICAQNGEGETHMVNLSSDTVTEPSKAMKEAMMSAPLGDDVFGEDPTVNALQEKVAELLGKEAALFVPTGTMGNLICVLNHCRTRGSEVLVGDLSHIHIWEQGGVSQLGGVHPRTLRNLPDGTFSLTELRQLVRGVDDHWPTTALVCVENTQNMVGGRVLPLAWLDELGVLCRELELPLHMDGARLFNAAAALGVPPSRIVKDCASVSICLSKGLGAPVGSVIVGSKDFIKNARRLRKALGGGMRQVGVLAAAGIYALDHVGPTLTRDHAYIQEVARAVVECKSEIIKCDPASAHTNILLLECDPEALPPSHLCERMDQVTDEEVAAIGERVVARILPITDTAVRMVVHCDITHEDIQSVINKLKYVIKEFDGKA
ncbi:probable low-specificity L-threonine aldolase 2 [Homarus americanus]|uniref:probable low-specificity L-threonine aldolase 2 n=1 Tax=Homarus americanus TaxID=6706 RepID=UPI001C46F1A8|nr:probable low-specificity L-threonine aldolase 2 [Homarus americanus]